MYFPAEDIFSSEDTFPSAAAIPAAARFLGLGYSPDQPRADLWPSVPAQAPRCPSASAMGVTLAAWGTGVTFCSKIMSYV